MIIFTPIRTIPVEMLEQKSIRQIVIYNLSSYFSDVPTLNMLIPSIENMPRESLDGDVSCIPTFDIDYINYVLNNDSAFLQFMSLIVPVYQDPDVLIQILISQSEFRDNITETLAKFIQQRYGYNTYIVNEIEDFSYVEESTFSIPGLFTLDKDLYRWRTMMSPQKGVQYE